MAGSRTLILYMQVGGGLLLIALALPLMRRKIGPNPWYGFRVRKTLEDPAVWYEANAYSARCLIAAGIVTILACLGLYFVPRLSDAAFAVACAVAALGSLAVAVVLSFVFLRRVGSGRDT